MITGREPTPEERRKMFRSQRFLAIGYLILGAAALVYGAFLLARPERAFGGRVEIGFGILALAASLLIWRRSSKYAP